MAVEMSARIGAMIVHTAAARGVSPEWMEKTTGFDLASAADPDARISLALEEALWNAAEDRTGDEDIGLHAAEAIQPGAFDVLDYVIRTAPTARKALERLARYNRLEHDAAVFTLVDRKVDRDAVTRVEHAFDVRLSGPVQSRHSAEFTIGAVVVVASQITGTPMPPRAVELRHPRPRSTAEHLRIFGVEPRFSCPVNAIEWDRALLERAVSSADAALSSIVERHAEAVLAARPEPTRSYADRVRHLLMTQLGAGDATLAAVSGQLKMSERSLQRRLTSDGVTFDALLDEVRRELALRYLADPKIAISEIAYLLGYSEPSPFHRAFRRWTGTTPREARDSG